MKSFTTLAVGIEGGRIYYGIEDKVTKLSSISMS